MGEAIPNQFDSIRGEAAFDNTEDTMLPVTFDDTAAASLDAAEKGRRSSSTYGINSATFRDDERSNGSSSLTPHIALYQRRAVFLSILIFSIGVGAGLAFLLTGISSAKNSQNRQFEKEADELTKSIESTWQEFAITSIWLHETCKGYEEKQHLTPSRSIGCTRQEFQNFYNYASNSGLGFDAVTWIGNVSHDERQAIEEDSHEYYGENHPELPYSGVIQVQLNENGQFDHVPRPKHPWYFVQHLLLPFSYWTHVFVDYDVHTSPFSWKLLESAINDMKPKVTARMPKFNNTSYGSSYKVQMLHPGIERREDPRYNAVAVVQLRVYDLLERAASSKEERLNAYLYDYVPALEAAGQDPAQFLSAARLHEDEDGWTTTIIDEISRSEVKKSSCRYRETFVSIEDRTWMVVVTDPEGSFDAEIFVPIFGGLCIIVAAAAIAVWFYSSTKRAAEIQILQAEMEADKAALLTETNLRLGAEVEERVNELRRTEWLANEKSREAEKAEARSESMVQTMSMLSHELRTPLQGIMGITSLALTDHNASASANPSQNINTADSDSSDSKVALPLSDSEEDHTTVESAMTPAGFKNKVAENLYTIQASSQLLLTLINNLLDVRKIETGMMENFEMECVDLKPVIIQCVETVKPLSLLSEVKLNVSSTVMDHHEDLLAVGAVLPIQQVLINLVGNGIKYSSMSLAAAGDPTTLDISIRKSTKADAMREASNSLCCSVESTSILPESTDEEQQTVIVDIRDRGNGIPEDEAHRVFGAFMMLKKHAGKSKGFAQPTGSGLGLQLCANMVDQMNGLVWANNCDAPNAAKALAAAGAEDHDGCVFSFYLECPTSAEAEEFLQNRNGLFASPTLAMCHHHESDQNLLEAGNAGPEIDAQHTLIPADLGTARVLLVDDTVINIKVIGRMLSVMGFKHVRTATSGAQALKMLDEDHECDLILTDYQMPGMDGLEFSSQARDLYSSLGVCCPLITLCSADYSPSLKEACHSIGIKEMLRKPITLSDLTKFVDDHRDTNHYFDD